MASGLFFDRNLFIVSDECVRTEGADWPKLVWIVDGRTETNPVPISTCPLPPLFAGVAAVAASGNAHPG